MARLEFSHEDKVRLINDIFTEALGKDFEYVVQAVREKMIRDGEIVEEEETNGTD